MNAAVLSHPAETDLRHCKTYRTTPQGSTASYQNAETFQGFWDPARNYAASLHFWRVQFASKVQSQAHTALSKNCISELRHT